MKNQHERLFEALASDAREERMDAIGALSILRCADGMQPSYVLSAADRIMASYHARNRAERHAIARLLETWFQSERSLPLSRRIASARMEELDEGIRESLLSASISAMPSADLIGMLACPSDEHLREGLGLLMMLEALSFRFSAREFAPEDVPALMSALRGARALRGSHIARPFLWRLEDVIAAVEAFASKFGIDLCLEERPEAQF